MVSEDVRLKLKEILNDDVHKIGENIGELIVKAYNLGVEVGKKEISE